MNRKAKGLHHAVTQTKRNAYRRGRHIGFHKAIEIVERYQQSRPKNLALQWVLNELHKEERKYRDV